MEVRVLKKIITLLCIFCSVFFLCPVNVQAAESTQAAAVPVWLCIPFAGLLLCIALMPLVKGEWWEAHQPHVVILWVLAMAIPFAIVYGAENTK